MKKIFLFFLVFASTGYSLREYYSITRSVRALGMGGAFYALSDDEYALFYNPSGLGLYRARGQGGLTLAPSLSSNMLSAISTLSKAGSSVSSIADTLAEYQGRPLYGNAAVMPYYMGKNFAIGLLVADVKASVAILGKDLDSDVDVTAISDSGLFIGYSHPALDDKLEIGGTLKGMFRAGGKKIFTLLEIAQDSAFKLDPQNLGGAGAGIDLDLGATYQVEGVPIGLVNRASLTLSNLLGSQFTISRIGGAPPALPRTFSLGWNTVFEGWEVFDHFSVLADLAEFRLGGESDPNFGARTGSFFKHVNLGVEAPMNGWFVPRFGFHQGNWTVGLGFNLKVMKLEFATYAEELADGIGRLSSRRYALRLTLGWTGDSPPPVLAPGERPEIKAKIETTPAKEESLSPPEPEKPTAPDKSMPRDPKSEEPSPPSQTDPAQPSSEGPDTNLQESGL